MKIGYARISTDEQSLDLQHYIVITMSSAIRSMERSTIHPMSCSGDDRVPPMFVVPVWKPRHPPPGFLFWRAASRCGS